MKINKKVVTLFFFTLIFSVGSSEAKGNLFQIAPSVNNVYFCKILFPHFSVLLTLIHLFLAIIFTFFIVKFYISWRKEKKLNEKMIHYIKAVHDFEKSLKLIKNPLEKIYIDENLNDEQKGKLHVAIWSTTNLQSTIKGLMEQEKSEKHFQQLFKANIFRRNRHGELLKNISEIRNGESHLHESDTPSSKETPADQIFMEKLITILKKNIENNNFTIDSLCQIIGMSRSSLYHKIKELTGLAPADFIRIYRLEVAKDLLKGRQYSISEVAYKTGFSDVKYFRAVFKRQYGTTPGFFTKSEE